jgi:phosphatidylinositol kinase/protein kinase (PI-3  family)
LWEELKTINKPVLGSWFAENFIGPDIWYNARVNFVKTTAIWSILGYVIGLGDRHGDNILVHLHTGEVTHIDFDCIYGKGAAFPTPDTIPFRLTSNILDVCGIFKEKGMF